jgi:DNA primase
MSDITDQIKERIDVVELVREYVPSLKKVGTNWKAPCPFHQEKTPSFVVSEEKQIWHCFGCAKGGDIFGFIREVEGVEFRDSMRLLAKKAGITLSKQDPKKESERTRTLDILRAASAWYHQALKTAKSANKVREYIGERKIEDSTRDSWQLGFSPDAWEGVSAYLQTKGYRNEEIAKAGISSINDRGGYYDRFRNRLMFPITDVHGTVVGFTARKMNDEDVGGKYINTPETDVYHKSSVLYGLSQAKQSIREKDLAVIVEGNMDCVSSHQAGIKNVVASSGTALTPEQVKLLKRFTKNISLAFDPDSAGQEALVRGLQIAWQEEMRIKIIALPENSDPDDLIKEDVKKWEKAIENSQDFMDWLIDRAEKMNDLKSADGKKQAAKTILTWIKRLPDQIEQTHYLQILSNKINVDETILRNAIQVQKKPQNRQYSRVQPEQNVPKKRDIDFQSGIRLLAILLLVKEWQTVPIEWLVDENHKNLYKNLNSYYDSHTEIDANLWLEELNEEEKILGREIILISEELSQSTDEDRLEEFKNLSKRIKDSYFKKELISVREKIKSAESTGSIDELQKNLAKWQDINKELQN